MTTRLDVIYYRYFSIIQELAMCCMITCGILQARISIDVSNYHIALGFLRQKKYLLQQWSFLWTITIQVEHLLTSQWVHQCLSCISATSHYCYCIAILWSRQFSERESRHRMTRKWMNRGDFFSPPIHPRWKVNPYTVTLLHSHRNHLRWKSLGEDWRLNTTLLMFSVIVIIVICCLT